MNLAKQMISGYKGTRKRKYVVNIDIDGNGHWPAHFEKRDRCLQCSKEGRRHEVFFGCKECKIHFNLHCMCQMIQFFCTLNTARRF
jgi:hypothetical protein